MYGVSAWECRLTQFFNHILTDWEDQTWSCARKKAKKETSTRRKLFNYKRKDSSEERNRMPLKLFLEGNRGIFTVILFSKDSDPNAQEVHL